MGVGLVFDDGFDQFCWVGRRGLDCGCRDDFFDGGDIEGLEFGVLDEGGDELVYVLDHFSFLGRRVSWSVNTGSVWGLCTSFLSRSNCAAANASETRPKDQKSCECMLISVVSDMPIIG